MPRSCADRGEHHLRVAALLTGSPAEAEDLVQASLVRLYRAWPRLDVASAPPDAYLRKIIVNTRRSWWQARWRRSRRSRRCRTAPTRPTAAGTRPTGTRSARSSGRRCRAAPAAAGGAGAPLPRGPARGGGGALLGCSVGTVKTHALPGAAGAAPVARRPRRSARSAARGQRNRRALTVGRGDTSDAGGRDEHIHGLDGCAEAEGRRLLAAAFETAAGGDGSPRRPAGAELLRQVRRRTIGRRRRTRALVPAGAVDALGGAAAVAVTLTATVAERAVGVRGGDRGGDEDVDRELPGDDAHHDDDRGGDRQLGDPLSGRRPGRPVARGRRGDGRQRGHPGRGAHPGALHRPGRLRERARADGPVGGQGQRVRARFHGREPRCPPADGQAADRHPGFEQPAGGRSWRAARPAQDGGHGDQGRAGLGAGLDRRQVPVRSRRRPAAFRR